jgi:SAM-dependent methyltransferase
MQIFLRELSGKIYETDRSIAYQWRMKRMQDFLDAANLPQNARIIDLGGSHELWDLVNHDFTIVVVNLPDNSENPDPTVIANNPQITYIEADATDLSHRFADRSFDFVFCNSVIEHVGGPDSQVKLAAEIQRLGCGYWVQTPSDRFPIEPHTGFPFYWRLPESMQNRLKNSWRKELPEWTEMIDGTTILTRRDMERLFPEASVYTEYAFGFEKSYAFYQPYDVRLKHQIPLAMS